VIPAAALLAGALWLGVAWRIEKGAPAR